MTRENPLSDPQERFALMIAKGDQSQAECYRQCFPHSRKWTPEAVYVKASCLANSGKVRIRVAELRKEVADRSQKDFEAYIAETRLMKMEMLKPDENGKPVSATAASKLHEIEGKALGLFVTQVKDVTADKVEQAESYVESLITSDDPLDRAFGRKKAGEWGFPHLVDKADELEATFAGKDAEQDGATVQ